jgi:hypothetical protein
MRESQGAMTIKILMVLEPFQTLFSLKSIPRHSLVLAAAASLHLSLLSEAN